MSTERSDIPPFVARWVLGAALIVLALSLGLVALFLAIEGRFREATPRRPAPTAAPALQTDEVGDRATIETLARARLAGKRGGMSIEQAMRRTADAGWDARP